MKQIRLSNVLTEIIDKTEEDGKETHDERTGNTSRE